MGRGLVCVAGVALPQDACGWRIGVCNGEEGHLYTSECVQEGLFQRQVCSFEASDVRTELQLMPSYTAVFFQPSMKINN